MSAGFLSEKEDGLQLRLVVQPRASRDEIVGEVGDELRIRIAAPPVDDAANRAIIRFMAKTLGCAKGQIRILRGEKSRHKTLSIVGIPIDATRARLTV